MALITHTTVVNHNGRGRSLRLGVGGVVAVAVVGAAGFVAGRPDKSLGDLSRKLTQQARRLRYVSENKCMFNIIGMLGYRALSLQ